MLVALGCVGFYAFGQGRVGAIVHQASGEIESWSSSSKQPSGEEVARVRADLALASQQAPNDPVANELIGIIEAVPRVDSVGDIEQAKEHFSRALTVRPTSPYTWANMVDVMYRMGDTGQQYALAISEAARLGPFEPEVQRTVAFYGLAVWNETTPEVRESVEELVASGMRRKPLEMLQIAQRRGRLDVACRHSSSAQGSAGSKAIQLCQSVEAIP